MHCPECRSEDVYLSRSGNPPLLMVLRLFFKIVRCHDCMHRFVVLGPLFGGPDVPRADARRRRPSQVEVIAHNPDQVSESLKSAAK